jgi:hypothetical protein
LKTDDSKSVAKAKGWFSTRRQKGKENEKKERALESTTLKIITFVFTLAAMGLALSFMPLFPQPLPLLLAALVAFVTFKTPRIGMPLGGALIGVGLIYHLAELNFIWMLDGPATRIGVIAAVLALFIILPFRFHRYKSAIAINLGIIAAMLLFFEPTYFLAIPLILTSAVFFKKSAGLSVIYYVILTVPLQIIQYFKFIATIVRPDWWVAAGSSPPVYVPLNKIFEDLQVSMTQFRLYDTSKVVSTIFNQVTLWPDTSVRSINDALTQYIDSFPGIFLFLIIVIGAILALIFLTRTLIKETNIAYGDRLSSPFVAVISTALFFILLNALHTPLAFNAQIDGVTIALATLATFAFTVPVSLLNYTPKKSATFDMINEKVRELQAKLQAFEGQLNIVKSSIPVNVSSPEGKLLILKDQLDETLNKTLKRFYDEYELDKVYQDLDKKVSLEIDDLVTELNVILSEFQVFVNCEYSNWLGKLKDIGLDFKPKLKVEFQREMPLEQRIESIKTILDAGQTLTNDVIGVVEPIYNILRSLYDYSLPEESQVVEFARDKLKKQDPWLATGALYSSLINWRKQYGDEVAKSIDYLKNSLTPIVDLGSQSEILGSILEDKLPNMLSDVKKAEALKSSSEKKEINVLNIITLRDLLEYSLAVSRDVLSIFFEELKSKEQSIEDLLPTKNYLWEKNITLRERMTTAVEVSFNPKNKTSQIIEELPKFLGYLDECVKTLSLYNERKELLLNYPMAEIAIQDQLKQKKKITSKDLPFETKYAEEYLRLFYMQRFSEFSLDNTNMILTKKE